MIVTLLFALLFLPGVMSGDPDIPGKKRQRAEEVINRPTIVRVSALPKLPVSQRQYDFLIDHPRLSMVLARAYDPALDLYRIEVRSDGIIHVDDPAGLAGDMELLSSDRGRRVYFITGHFDILKLRFNGQMVMDISYSGRPGQEQAPVDSKTTCHIRVNSAVAGFFTKVVTFLFPKKVDERIGRFSNAVKKVAFAVHDDPSGAYKRLAASGEVGPGELKEFARMFM